MQDYRLVTEKQKNLQRHVEVLKMILDSINQSNQMLINTRRQVSKTETFFRHFFCVSVTSYVLGPLQVTSGLLNYDVFLN